jgi:dUTP pyrophosphatase
LDKLHGWDFFIPTDLTIFDFANNLNVYINEYVDFPDIENKYMIPLIFNIKINNRIEPFVIIAEKNVVSGNLKPIIKRYNGVLMDILLTEPEINLEEAEILMTTYLESIKILPGSKILIPSGIHVKLPKNVILNAENKSGVASKRGLIKGAQVIDVDYQGQIHINLINPTTNSVYIRPNEKIVQFVPYFMPNMFESKEYFSKEELYKNSESIRGEGGFGSSGN